MRPVFIFLIIALVILQHKLWLGDGSIIQWITVQQKLVPPREINLERALEWIEDDELVEVTPISVRIRKRYLDANSRKRFGTKK